MTLTVFTATPAMSLPLVDAFPEITALSSNIDDLDANIQKADLIIFTGGCDINPRRYGESPRGAVGWSDQRDEIEFEILKKALSRPRRKPKILGICRGNQLINVELGGTLVQDIDSDKSTYHEYTHDLSHIEPNPFDWLKIVNSIHHQGLRHIGTLGRGHGKVLAKHKAVPEITVWANTAIGVQFHPELFSEEHYTRFFDLVKEWVKGKVSFREEPKSKNALINPERGFSVRVGNITNIEERVLRAAAITGTTITVNTNIAPDENDGIQLTPNPNTVWEIQETLDSDGDTDE